MEAWLSKQSANSATSPYTVKMNVSSLGGSSDYYGTAGRALRDNSTKYVNLDLSGSTFTSIEEEAFQYCTSLTSVTMPDSVGVIERRAFKDCTSINSITISNKLTLILPWAFYNCKSLTGLNIPDSVVVIGGSQVFTGCTSLKEINVDSGNKNYISENGVLYNNDKTMICCYPAGKTDRTFTIPDSVTKIEKLAFLTCDSLTTVTFEGTIASGNFGENNSAFPRDLVSKYLAGGIGTYTTRSPGWNSVWTKQ